MQSRIKICLNLILVLKFSSGILNTFSYNIIEPEDQQWGNLVDGRWTGISGLVADEVSFHDIKQYISEI